MNQDEKSLAPKLRFLLEAERARPDAPADAKSAAQERLAALLGPGAGLGGGSGGPGSSGPGSSGPSTSGAGPAAANAARGSQALTVAKFASVFALGGLVVGGLTSTLGHREDRVVNSALAPAILASVTAAARAAVSTESPLEPAATPSLERSAPSPAPSASVAAPSRDTQLAAERALLERARSALAHGDGSAAFAAIHEHEQKFARGQLSEEREVLAVQALALAGRSAEASERAARFRKLFPHSLLLPVVEQALH